MSWKNPPRRPRLTTAVEINAAIAKDLRDRRIEAGVTLEALGDLFGEQRAVINKHEKQINQIHVGKYLAIIHFLRETCPEHPAHVLIEAIGPKRLQSLLSDDRPQARLAGYLDLVDMTRSAAPEHPALPRANYLLYERG